MNSEAAPQFIGRYQVLHPLGQGAMGRVLLALDPVLDREVAIKLLRDDLKLPEDQKQGLLKRMRQEARASARVSHPNIVALHDMGEDPKLGLYLVFEYAEGITLKKRLESGPLKAPAAARLARELGSALATAHQAGVLHRDIKPDNIILSQTGAKIADFGIARVPDSTLTRDGGLLGTPAYSSPESIASGSFSPLSDQFSLAATLYEAVAGVRAFPGQDAVAVATKISTEDPLPIAASRGLGPRVDEVLARGLAKEPSQRFSTALELGDAFAESLAGETRPDMATIPDQHHMPRDAAVHRAGTTTSKLLAAATVGALFTAVAFQLPPKLRSTDGERPSVSVATARTSPPQLDARPTGWLAASPPKPLKKHRDTEEKAAPAASRAALESAKLPAKGPNPPAAKSAPQKPSAPAVDAGP